MYRSANNIGGEAYVLKLRQVPTLSVEHMLIQHNITTKPERWSTLPWNLILILSQNGVWRESKVFLRNPEDIINQAGASTAMQFIGLVDQIVMCLRWVSANDVARLGEAWRFRQIFERGRALMEEQDAWCLKAQVAASTGKFSILEGQNFPSKIELDVIVGMS